MKQQIGIAGSASIEGTAQTVGIMDTTSDDVMKRATIIWVVALAALVFFHVGGAKL